MKKIAVIDYGMSNLHSVVKAFGSVITKNYEIYIARQETDLLNASCLVLPGQGAASSCVTKLTKAFPEIKSHILNKPFMGICMGFQILFDHTEEDNGVDCFSIIKGNVEGFHGKTKNLKVPHMGWNMVCQKHNHKIWKDIPNNSFFYFVHSYYAQCLEEKDQFSTSKYDVSFTSSVLVDNIFACQFHPEKSSKHGLNLISNFLKWSEHI